MAVKPPPPLVMLRSVEMNGSVWFFASDVCDALGIPKTKPERLSASMLSTAHDEAGRSALTVNAEGLLCLLGIRGYKHNDPKALLLGSRLLDQEGREQHAPAPFSWSVVQGAKDAIQAVNVAWPAEARSAAA